jgi:hypothetical protein
VWQNSGNPVTQVNPAAANLENQLFYPAIGASAAGPNGIVNFGQFPFYFQAPSGFKALLQDPFETTLTFDDDTSLATMLLGDVVTEVAGDASGTIAALNPGSNQMTVSFSSGTWTVGSTVQDDTTLLPSGAPTTQPPDPGIYSLIASATNDTTNKTSFPVAAPPLDPLSNYFARVRYKSNTVVTTSNYSPYSQFITGTLP